MTGSETRGAPAEQRDRLRRRSAEAARATAHQLRRAGEAPAAEPGRLLVHPATAEHGVEWLLLERQGTGGRALVVPADTFPLAGPRDLELGAEDPAGPLTLRCSFALWLEPAVLEEATATGRVEAATVDRARDLTGGPEGAHGRWAEAEVRDDPDLEDHYRQVLAPARQALAGAVGARGRAGGSASPGGLSARKEFWQGLAAVLLVGLVAAGVWGSYFQWRVAELTGPNFLPELEELVLGGGERGPGEILEVTEGSPLLLSVLVDPESGPPGPGDLYRLELVSRSTGARWISPTRPARPGSYLRVLLRYPVDWGGTHYRVRLQTVGPDGSSRVVDEMEVELEVVEGPP